MRRIAFVSPLPPERTGIGDYSYELLEELRHHLDVVAVVRDDLVGVDRAPEGVEVIGLSDLDATHYDLPVYQMGNNPKFHRYLFGRALDEPGLLVMHDPSLADFYAEMCWGADGATFRYEVTYDTPDIGPSDELPLVEVGDGRRDLDRLRILFARRIVFASIRTLVNSDAMAAEMRRRYPGNEIHAISLPAPLLDPTRASPRTDDTFRFGVFGGINYYKRIEPLMEAFAALHAELPHVRMTIAGRADDRPLLRRAREYVRRPELGGAIELKTDLTLEALEQEMLDCDVAMSLRWPTAGEMSATLMRTLGAGKPSVVSDVLQFRDLDEEFCWRVPIEPDEERTALYELMAYAAADPERCRRAGRSAAAYVARSATYAKVAERYAEHVEACAPRRASALARRRPQSLRATTPFGVNLLVATSGLAETAEAARRAAAALVRAGVDAVVVEVPEPARGTTREGRDEREESGRDDPRFHSALAAVERRDAALAAADDEPDEGPARPRRAAERAGVVMPYGLDCYFADTLGVGALTELAIGRILDGHRAVAAIAPEALTLPGSFTRLVQIVERIFVPNDLAATALGMNAAIPIDAFAWPAADCGPATAPPPGNRPLRVVGCLDARETIARANPFGVIEAFRRALAPAERGARAELVLVARWLSGASEAEGIIRRRLGEVGGALISVEDEAGFRAELARADVVVSLRRAEGYALGVRDALAAGVPVVTGVALWGSPSGLEYLTGGPVVDLDLGAFYLDGDIGRRFNRGQCWHEPDLERAGRQLRAALDALGSGRRPVPVARRDEAVRMRQALGDLVARPRDTVVRRWFEVERPAPRR